MRAVEHQTRAIQLGVAATALGTVSAFAAGSLIGGTAYGGGGHLSASSDWAAYAVTVAIFLIPILGLLGSAFAALYGAAGALAKTSAPLVRPGRALRLLGRVIGIMVGLLVVGLLTSTFGILADSACPSVQHNASDATCVAGTWAVLAALAVWIGSIVVLVKMRGLRARLIEETLRGRTLPAMPRWLTAYVIIYADRRGDLSDNKKRRLALRIEGPLREAAPALVIQDGPLGALNKLADQVQ